MIFGFLPSFLLAAAFCSFIPYHPDGNIYWPVAGVWALALAITAYRHLTTTPLMASTLAILLLAPNLAGASLAPDVQFILLPVVAFLLSYLTLITMDIGAEDLIPAMSFLLANAFIGLSALAFYYVDRIVGTSFIPTNETFMLHLSSGLIGIGLTALIFHLASIHEVKA